MAIERITTVKEFFENALTAQKCSELANNWWRECKFCKALEAYIEDYENCSMVAPPWHFLEDKDIRISVDVLHARDVHYRKASDWDKDGIDTVSFTINVTYSDVTNEYSHDKSHKTLSLWVPAELVEKFDPKTFKAWVKEKEAGRKEEVKSKILELLNTCPALRKELKKEL